MKQQLFHVNYRKYIVIVKAVGSTPAKRTKTHLYGAIRMKLTDTFIRRVNGNGKAQKHSDGGQDKNQTRPAAETG